MVLFWGDELANLPGYRDWVRAHFRLVGELNDPRGWLKEIYVRADEPDAAGGGTRRAEGPRP
jgi:hypothetical protein